MFFHVASDDYFTPSNIGTPRYAEHIFVDGMFVPRLIRHFKKESQLQIMFAINTWPLKMALIGTPAPRYLQ